MNQHHIPLGGFAPGVLHVLQKEIHQDLVEFPFYFFYTRHEAPKNYGLGKTTYDLWIRCYKWADKNVLTE